MKFHSLIFVLILFCFQTLLLAQQEYTLHFNRNLPQSMTTNPSFQGQDKLTIMLPSVVFNFGNNAFTMNDLVQKNSANDSTYLDVNGIIDNMSEENIFQIQSEVQTFALYFSIKDWYFNLGMGERMDFKLAYPKDLVDLVWNGNAKFIGQTIDIGPNININYYKEFSIGVGKKIDQWNVGGTMRLLSGIANVNSIKSSLTLRTEEDDYATTLSTDYVVKTSGVADPLTRLLQPISNFDNPGLAFDLGGSYRLNDRWEFTQSLLNIGGIKWKNDVTTYTSKGSFTFSGVDLSEFLNEDQIAFDDFTDSLKNLYFEEEDGGEYFDYLVPETYTSVMYTPGRNTTIGAMMHLTYFSGVQFGMSIYAGKSFSKYLHLGLSYNIKNRRYDNIGFDISVGPRGFKIFFVTDNLLTALNARRGQNITWRYGMNIGIGDPNNTKRKKVDEDTTEEVPLKKEN